MEIIDLLRQFRIGPFAIFDFVVSYLGIYLLANRLTAIALKVHLKISRKQWLWLVLPISIVFHLIFAQDTPMTMMVTDISGFYLVKIVILFMLFMGLKDTKIVRK